MFIVHKRRVAQDIDPWGRVRHVHASDVEEDLYHYFVTLDDINNWNYCYSYAVLTLGDQYIYGIKTFDEFPVTPYEFPIYTYQVANKGYVDSRSSASVTFENLNDNGDVGVNSYQVSVGNHSHTNLPSGDQKDAMDNASLPSGANPFLTWNQHADHSDRHINVGQDKIDDATIATPGLMSAADKVRLDGALIAPKVETLIIAVQNVIPDLAFTPVANSLVVFPVGSVASNGVDWSLAVKTITWDAPVAGYDLEIGEIVTVLYCYSV